MKLLANCFLFVVMFAWFAAELAMMAGMGYLFNVVGIHIVLSIVIVFVYIVQLVISWGAIGKLITYAECNWIR